MSRRPKAGSSRPAAHQQAVDGLPTEIEISRRNSGTVAVRDIERLQVVVQGRQRAVGGGETPVSQITYGLGRDLARGDLARANALGLGQPRLAGQGSQE